MDECLSFLPLCILLHSLSAQRESVRRNECTFFSGGQFRDAGSARQPLIKMIMAECSQRTMCETQNFSILSPSTTLQPNSVTSVFDSSQLSSVTLLRCPHFRSLQQPPEWPLSLSHLANIQQLNLPVITIPWT